MIEQYQREISQIHVPTELLEKTKLAMREEEEKSRLGKSGKILTFPRIAVAAAVLVLVMIPVVGNSRDKGNVNVSEGSPQKYLSEHQEVELQTIKKDKNWLEELIDMIQDLFE